MEIGVIIQAERTSEASGFQPGAQGMANNLSYPSGAWVSPLHRFRRAGVDLAGTAGPAKTMGLFGGQWTDAMLPNRLIGVFAGSSAAAKRAGARVR